MSTPEQDAELTETIRAHLAEMLGEEPSPEMLAAELAAAKELRGRLAAEIEKLPRPLTPRAIKGAVVSAYAAMVLPPDGHVHVERNGDRVDVTISGEWAEMLHAPRLRDGVGVDR